jgi:hypothetical protein
MLKHDKYLGFEVLTAVVMNFAIIWDIAPRSPYVNGRVRGTYNLHLQGKKSAESETIVGGWFSRNSCPTSCFTMVCYPADLPP